MGSRCLVKRKSGGGGVHVHLGSIFRATRMRSIFTATWRDRIAEEG